MVKKIKRFIALQTPFIVFIIVTDITIVTDLRMIFIVICLDTVISTTVMFHLHFVQHCVIQGIKNVLKIFEFAFPQIES